MPNVSERRTAALLALCMALLLAAGLYLVAKQRDGIWRTARENTLDIAQGMESSINARLGQSIVSLREVAVDLRASRTDIIAALRNAIRYDPLSAYLGVLHGPGRKALVIDAQGRRVPLGWELVLPDLIEPPGRGEGLHVQPLLQLPGRSGWLMPVSLGLEGDLAGGTAFALVSAERIVAGAEGLKLLPGSRISLVADDGRRLLRHAHGQSELEINGPPLVPERLAAMRAASAGNLDFVSGIYFSEQIAGYVRSAELPLYVAVLIPVDELTARWLREASGPLLILLLGLVGAVSFGLRLRTALRTQRRQLAHQVYLASHDALTGLANRDALVQALDRRIASEPGLAFAVCLLNLGHFKDINDTLGHSAGDQALVEIGRRVSTLMPATSCAARLGGAEFVVHLHGQADQAAIEDFCLRLQATVRQSLMLNGIELEMSAAIGVACYPADAASAAELLRCADVAMQTCKSDLGSFCRYQTDMDFLAADALSLKSELSRTLREGGLDIVYQPKIDLASGRLVGVEALSRWQHPQRGSIPPDRFVPLAENTDLIHVFTQHVLDRSIAQAARWHAAGHRISVAVNISVNNLLDHGFVERLCATLDRHGLPAEGLELEVTESAVMRHPELMLRRLRALRQMGVRLSIDDFGTGFASLSYLKQLPVHALKIDKVFVLDLEHDGADQRIVSSAIQLAHGFGMSVVAEGVESAASAELLRGFGCDTAQGFFFARPQAAEALEGHWLRDPR